MGEAVGGCRCDVEKRVRGRCVRDRVGGECVRAGCGMQKSGDRFGLYGLSDAPLFPRMASIQQTKRAPTKERITEMMSSVCMPSGAVGCEC